MAIFKSENYMGIMEDTCEIIGLPLFYLSQFLEGPQQFQEAQLAISIHVNLCTSIHEMIEMAIGQQNAH